MKRWWTGEDSNLRSPQGAADLQSAGFSHSPTRPANLPGKRPGNEFAARTQQSSPTNPTRAGPDCCTGHSAMQKGPVSRDTRPIRFSREESVRIPEPKNTGPLKLSWRRDLNPRPSDYKSDALPTELRQHCANPEKLSQRQSNCKRVSLPKQMYCHHSSYYDQSVYGMFYCTAGFANWLSSIGTLWCTSLIVIVYAVSPSVW